MKYKIDKKNLELSVAFVARDVERKNEKLREKEQWQADLQKLQKELQQLEKKRGPLNKKREEARLACQMFDFGGEQIAEKDPVEREMRRLENQIEERRRCINKLQTKSVLGEEEKKFEEAKRLYAKGDLEWSHEGSLPLLALKVQGLIRRDDSQNPVPGEQAFAVIERYQSIPKVQARPADREKAAFLTAAPHQLLKVIFQKAAAVNQKEVEQTKAKLNVALEGLSLEFCPYPALLSYQKLETVGWARVDDLRFWGECYGYLPVNTQNGEKFVKEWLKWFETAMKKGNYHLVLEDALKSGFEEFLRYYGKNEGKCLRDGLGKWERQERFSEYAPAFRASASARYNAGGAFTNAAAQFFLSSDEKYPLLKAFDDSFKSNDLVRICIGEMKKKNWLDWELWPSGWEQGWIEEQLKPLVFRQLKEYVNGKRKISSEMLGVQLDCYFTEVMARGVWDPELDAGICAMLDKAVRSGFGSDWSRQVEENLEVLVKFKGKGRFAPYEKILREGARESSGVRIGRLGLKRAERSLGKNFRIPPWRAKKFWLMLLLSGSLGMNWLVYEVGGLILAVLLLWSGSSILYRREILALELAFWAGILGFYLAGSEWSLWYIGMKAWQASGSVGTVGGFLNYFGLILFPVGIVTLLAFLRVRKMEKGWKEFQTS